MRVGAAELPSRRGRWAGGRCEERDTVLTTHTPLHAHSRAHARTCRKLYSTTALYMSSTRPNSAPTASHAEVSAGSRQRPAPPGAGTAAAAVVAEPLTVTEGADCGSWRLMRKNRAGENVSASYTLPLCTNRQAAALKQRMRVKRGDGSHVYDTHRSHIARKPHTRAPQLRAPPAPQPPSLPPALPPPP